MVNVPTSSPTSVRQARTWSKGRVFASSKNGRGSQSKWEKLHAELYRLLSPAVARFTALLESEDEDDQETAEGFRADLNDYVRKYGFLAQIVPYRDAELERLHLYGRYLLNRLPRRADGGVDIGEVDPNLLYTAQSRVMQAAILSGQEMDDLSHLRVEKTGEYDVSLTPEGPATMQGFGDGSGGAKEAEKSLLSELIEKFNERFGTDFTEQDFIRPFEEATADPKVKAAAVVNDEANFGLVFDNVFADKMADHIDTIAGLGRQYFGPDKGFKSSLDRSARKAAWRMIRREAGLDDDV
jgi:type I restriction enzyme, R subunit